LEGTVEGAIEGTPEGTVEGAIEGGTEGTMEGGVEGTQEGTVEGTPEGSIEGGVEGISEGTPEGSVEGSPEGSVDGSTEGTTEGLAEGTTEGISEGEGEPVRPCHSADHGGLGIDCSGADFDISLSELLRVVQFFNLGRYGCQDGEPTEDGYVAGGAASGCDPHDSDYVIQDWSINLSELLRLVQFFNLDGYYRCLDGEDGFCAGEKAG